MIRIILLFFLISCGHSLVALDQVNVKLFTYRGDQSNLNLYSLDSLFIRGDFKSIKGDIIIDRNNTSPLYIAVKISDHLPIGAYQLVIEDCFIDKITLLDSTNNLTLGAIYPFQTRPIDFTFPVFSIYKKTTENGLYFLKVQNYYHNSVIPVRMFNGHNFQRYVLQNYVFWGFYLGLLFLALLISFWMSLIEKEQKFIYVFLAILSNIIWVLFNNGLGFQFLWSNWPQLTTSGRFIAYHFSILFLYICFVKFIRQNSLTIFQQRIHMIFIFGILISIFFGFNPFQLTNSNPWFPIYFYYANFLLLGVLVYIIYHIFKAIKNDQVNVWFYLLSFLIVLFSHISLILIKYHLLAPMNWIFQLNYWGIFIQVITLMVGLILQYVFQKKENVRMELQVLQAQESERKRISVDMHDELGASFSTIRLISELALKQTGVDKLKSSLQTIHQKSIHINQTLREIIWTLQSENDSLESLLYYLIDYGQSFFSELQISFEFELPNEINYYKISGSRRRHILFIMKELFQNIAKHSGTSKMQLKVTIESNLLQMIIQDFGKGMGNQVQFGNGIHNMKSRIQILDGDLHFWDEKLKGATTHIIIPL